MLEGFSTGTVQNILKSVVRMWERGCDWLGEIDVTVCLIGQTHVLSVNSAVIGSVQPA